MELKTLIGCIPVVGTVVGIIRIADAVLKNKVQDSARPIFESLKERGTREEEIFHGACELVPVFGPMFYGFTRLCLSIAAGTLKSASGSEGSLKETQNKVVGLANRMNDHVESDHQILSEGYSKKTQSGSAGFGYRMNDGFASEPSARGENGSSKEQQPIDSSSNLRSIIRESINEIRALAESKYQFLGYDLEMKSKEPASTKVFF